MKNCISILWVSEIKKEGWLKEGGAWHFYKDGNMIRDGWAKYKTKWCYMNSKGEMVKSEWIKVKGHWYYIKSDGYMASNEWVKDSKGWCYLDTDGKMHKGWLRWKDNFYYLNPNGYMLTGGANLPCKFDEKGRLTV